MTAILWATSVIMSLFAAHRARRLGELSMQAYNFRDPLALPLAWIRGVWLRLLIYFAPPLVFAGVSIAIMPHWGGYPAVVILLVMAYRAGSRRAITTQYLRWLRHYETEKGLDPEEAKQEAVRMVAFMLSKERLLFDSRL
jgi:hypothetical protein